MTARLTVLEVRHRHPDVRLYVRLYAGSIGRGDRVMLWREGRVVGEGLVTGVRPDRPADPRDQVVSAPGSGELWFKEQTELDGAEPGDGGGIVEGDGGVEAIAAAARADLERLAADRPVMLLPLRVETHFEAPEDGRHVLKIRVWPDAFHVLHALPKPEGAAAIEDDRLRAAFTARARDEGEAVAKAELQAAVGPAEARRVLANSRGDGPPAFVALPERLYVIAHLPRGERVQATGRRLPETVPMSFGEDADDEVPPWMQNYAAAERIGFAVSLPWPTGAELRVARLMVVGLPRAGREALRDALERRAQTGTVSLAGAGTPTKGAALPQHPPVDQGVDMVQALLGSRPPDSHPPARDLAPPAAELVWHAAAAPALRRGVLGPSAHEPAAQEMLEAVRQRYRGAVRADGPMPSLVLDDLPFGLWPVMPGGNDPLAPPDEVFAAVADAMRERRDDRRKEGPWRALLQSLCEQEQGRRWQVRRTWEGLLEVHRLASAKASDLRKAERQAQNLRSRWEAAERTVREWTNGMVDPRFANSAALGVSERDAPLLCGPLILPNADAGGAQAEYLAEIARRPARELLEWKFTTFPSVRGDDRSNSIASVAETLVVAALRGRLAAAAAAQLTADPAERAALEAAIGLGAPGREPEMGWSDLLGNAFRLDEAIETSLEDWLMNLARRVADDVQEPLREALEVLEAARTLAAAPVERAHRALAGALDLFSTRIDAWATASASTRLAAMEREPWIGAFGMVEGIEERQDEETSFYLAPSTDHATTAAILDAAEAEAGSLGLVGIARVRLPPKKARAAVDFAEALRQGLEPEEVLGRLALARIRHPEGPPGLSANGVLPPNSPSAGEISEAMAERFPLEGAPGQLVPGSRVDGLALLKELRDTHSEHEWTLRDRRLDLPADFFRKLKLELDEVLTSYRDLLFSEAVHGLAGGRTARGKAALDAVGFGAPVPARFDVLEAEPPSLAISTSFSILCDGADVPGAEDLAHRLPAASEAARALTGMPLGQVIARVGPDDDNLSERKVLLREVMDDPLAWLVMAAPGQPTNRIVRGLCVAALADGVDELPRIDIDLNLGDGAGGDPFGQSRDERGADDLLGRGDLPIGGGFNPPDPIIAGPDRIVRDVALDQEARDWLWAAGRAAETIARVRPLRADDLPGAPPKASAADESPVADHRAAAEALAASLSTAEIRTAPKLLRRAAAAGFLPLLPDAVHEAGREGLHHAARALGAVLSARLAAKKSLIALSLPAAPLQWPLPNGALQLRGHPTTAGAQLAGWIDLAARVRAPLVPVDDMFGIGLAEEERLLVWQWTDATAGMKAGDAFAGLAADLGSDAETVEGLVGLDARSLPSPDHLGGYLVDRIGEAVARPDRTLGLALRHPGPTAQAPQAALLVPVPEGRSHSLEHLIAAVGMAFDMAIARGAALGDLPDPNGAPKPNAAAAGLGQMLPLLWLAPGQEGAAACDFGEPVVEG